MNLKGTANLAIILHPKRGSIRIHKNWFSTWILSEFYRVPWISSEAFSRLTKKNPSG
jgi:hypothetical protein